MNLSDLIKHVGDENVVIQNIMHSSPVIMVGKKDARITFYTDKATGQDLIRQAASSNPGKWTALVVLIPTERIP